MELVGTRIVSTSTQYVVIEVSAEESGVPMDLTSSTVEVAFTLVENGARPLPDSGDYNAASWMVDPTPRTRYLARCLVGPGIVDLSPGLYAVFVHVTNVGVEEPVLEAPTRLEVV